VTKYVQAMANVWTERVFVTLIRDLKGHYAPYQVVQDFHMTAAITGSVIKQH